MRKLLLFFTLVGSVSLAEAQNTKQENEIIALSNRKFRWLIEKKYDSLNLFLDDRLSYVHSNGWIQTKKDIFDDSKSGKLNYTKITVKEVSARVYTKAAIVNGAGTFEASLDGKPFSIELRYTEVYVKSGKLWKLASRHANRMP